MRKGLTENERRVLYGLAKYPTLNDRGLSERTGVKHSTITAIRRRLHQEGYFKTVRIPAVYRLGYELTVVGYGRYNPSADGGLRKRFIDAMKRENKGLYYFLTSPDFFLFVSASKNYTSFRRWAERLEFEFSDTDLFGNSTRTWAVFPHGTTKPVRHFDYSRPLSLLFGIGEKITEEAPFQKVEVRELTKKERTVLKGLVDHPEFTDAALSERTNASRQAISSMKKRFEKAGLIRTARVVDLGKVGYRIYSFVHMMFSPKSTPKARIEGTRKALEVAPSFLASVGNSESIWCSAHRNFDEYSKARKALGSLYAGREYVVGEPEVELVALNEADTPVNCDFSNLIGEALDGLPV
ncbi:MAG: hypothetical protein KAW39_06780 [Thermoplasmata archaeon]|nr:hypothetical protein [Thermoplasmata archaeon]